MRELALALRGSGSLDSVTGACAAAACIQYEYTKFLTHLYEQVTTLRERERAAETAAGIALVPVRVWKEEEACVHDAEMFGDGDDDDVHVDEEEIGGDGGGGDHLLGGFAKDESLAPPPPREKPASSLRAKVERKMVRSMQMRSSVILIQV